MVQKIQSIMLFAGDIEGHYLEYRMGAWFVNSKSMRGAKALPNIMAGVSELERASRIPSGMFTVGYPDFAIIPINSRVG